MASLIHEPDRPRKPWRVDWTERRRRRTRRFATKREAQAFVGDLARGARAGTEGRMTLDDWLERWLRTHGLAWEPRTRHDRAGHIDRLVSPHLGAMRLAEIGSGDVRAWRADLLRAGETPYTADRARQVLSAALGAAVEDDLIAANPCSGIKKLPRRPRRRRVAELAEVEAIRLALADPRDRASVSLMAYAGLRPSEARELRWEDVGERTVVVRAAQGSDGRAKRTKTGAERSVPLIAPLRDDLDAVERDGPLVAPVSDPRNWAARVWRPARERAGLVREVVPYALRHTFASLLIAEGRNPWQIARLMGHANPQMVITTYGDLFAEAELAEPTPMEPAVIAARHAASSS